MSIMTIILIVLVVLSIKSDVMKIIMARIKNSDKKD